MTFRKFEWSAWKLLDFRILFQIPQSFWGPWAGAQTPCPKSYASWRTPLWKFLPTGLCIPGIWLSRIWTYNISNTSKHMIQLSLRLGLYPVINDVKEKTSNVKNSKNCSIVHKAFRKKYSEFLSCILYKTFQVC